MSESRSEGGIASTNDRSGPKCRDGVPWPTMVVVRQSCQAKTIAVDEVNRNQNGCGRNRSVAGLSGPVAKALRTRRRASEDRWHGGGHERSGDGEGRAPPIFQPGNVTRPNERPGSGTETPGGAWISHPTHQWCTPANHASACDGNTANGEKSHSINALACRNECDQNARIARPRDYCRGIRVLPRKHRGTEAVRPPRA